MTDVYLRSRAMNDLNHHGFNPSPADLDARINASRRALDVLISRPAPLARRFKRRVSFAIAYGRPELHLLPHMARDAEDLGFRPVCYILTGVWPVPEEQNPHWVGPEGFVNLVALPGYSFVLVTMLTDGFRITSGHVRTDPNDEARDVGDFAMTYSGHLAAVRRHVDTTGAQPIYTPDRALIRMAYGVSWQHLSD
ncbi:MAG: hypothetical protein R3E66_23615 [bacterium]